MTLIDVSLTQVALYMLNAASPLWKDSTKAYFHLSLHLNEGIELPPLCTLQGKEAKKTI